MTDAQTPPRSWHIASYPRSGNHLVRALLEAYGRRPTLGCPGVRGDPPIHERKPNRKAGLIVVDDPRPIGYKAHFLNELLSHEKAAPDAPGLILITRDPVHAIASHVHRIVGRRRFGRDRAIRRAVAEGVDDYLALVYFFAGWERAKIHLRFEDLTGERARDAAAALLDAVRIENRPDPDRHDSIMALARESQQSLRRPDKELLADLQAAIAGYISYDRVLETLGRAA